MDFSVFESLAGSRTVMALSFGAAFSAVLMWRFTANILANYKRVQDGEEETSDFMWHFVRAFGFLAACGAFIYLTN